MMEKKYYALFCTQTQTFLNCGLNSTSLKEFLKSYREYDWEMEKNLSDDKVLEVIRNNDYVVEDSLTPFDSLENDLED